MRERRSYSSNHEGHEATRRHHGALVTAAKPPAVLRSLPLQRSLRPPHLPFSANDIMGAKRGRAPKPAGLRLRLIPSDLPDAGNARDVYAFVDISCQSLGGTHRS